MSRPCSIYYITNDIWSYSNKRLKENETFMIWVVPLQFTHRKWFKEIQRGNQSETKNTACNESPLVIVRCRQVLCTSQFQNRIPLPPSPNPAFDWSFAPYALVQWGIWPKLRPAQSGAFDFRVKSLDFVILSAFSMCTLFTVNCSYIHCFVGAFEIL